MSARSNTCRWAVISLLLVITCNRAFAGKTIYVDDDAAGANNGSSWTDAYKYLQAVQAAQPIIEVASEQGIFYAEVHRALQYMLRTGFDIERGETGYRIIEFPELGEINSRDINKKLWQYWLKVGPEYTKKQFDKYYAELKVAQKEDPNDRSRHRYLQRQMLKGGVATLPYLMEKIEQGDESMMSSVHQLVRKRPPQRSQQDIDKLEQTFQDRNKCLNWWKQNKEEWILFSRINR